MELKKKDRDKYVFCLLFLLPSLIFYCAFVIVPIFTTFRFSLTRWNGIGPRRFIGWANYAQSILHPHSVTVLKNTGTLVVTSLLVQIPFGLIFGYLLFRGLKGYKLFRALYYIPVVIAPVAIGTMFRVFFNGEIGVLTSVLELIGLDVLNREWLSDPKLVLYMVIIPSIWQYNGYYVVIFVARMMAISPDIFESAVIDGANSVTMFFRIVLPQVFNMVIICSVFIVTGCFKAFAIPFLMTKGGPGYSSAFLTVFMYRKAFEESRFGFGSTVGIEILFLALLVSLFLRSFNRFYHENQ